MLDVERGNDALSKASSSSNTIFIAISGFCFPVNWCGQIHRLGNGELAAKARIEIHLPNLDPVIKRYSRGNDFQLVNLGGGFGAFMWFHIADDNVDTSNSSIGYPLTNMEYVLPARSADDPR